MNNIVKCLLAAALTAVLFCRPLFAGILDETSFNQLYDAGVQAAKEDFYPLPSAAGGFLSGLIVPLAGPVVLVSLSGLVKPETPSHHIGKLPVQNREAFIDGYTDTRMAYRRRSLIASGIVGTALTVCFLLILPGMLNFAQD